MHNHKTHAQCIMDVTLAIEFFFQTQTELANLPNFPAKLD